MLKGEHSTILSTFIKLPFVIGIFVLSIFDWPFYTGFTVQHLIVWFKATLFIFKFQDPNNGEDVLKFQTLAACQKAQTLIIKTAAV